MASRIPCSSIVAGAGSESDDFGDVVFLAGNIDESNKVHSILNVLALDHLPGEVDAIYSPCRGASVTISLSA